MYVIGDIKRNDIGATATAYAEAYLGKTRVGDTEIAPYGCDSITVNGYLGTDGVEPFLKECRSREKSLFMLVKTSNPSSGELQNRDMEGKQLYARMAEMVAKWGEGLDTPCGYNQIGAVVGATYPEEQKSIRELLPKSYFLVPGFVGQGAEKRHAPRRPEGLRFSYPAEDPPGCRGTFFGGEGQVLFFHRRTQLFFSHKTLLFGIKFPAVSIVILQTMAIFASVFFFF